MRHLCPAIALGWWCVAAVGSAAAQTPAAGVPAGTREATVDFDIPAQPMAAALNRWAVQADAQVFVDPGPIARLLAPAVKGSLTPRQALRVLLGRSNLQVTRGANGVYVIKPRAAVVAAPEPAEPASPPPPAAAPAPPPVLTAHAGEGPWAVGLAGDYAQDGGTSSGGASAALTGEYFITDHFAASLAVTSPRDHSFEVPGITGVPAYGARARLQSSALKLRYYFAPESRLRAYVSAGFGVTTLSDPKGVTGLDRVTVGPAAEAGLAVRLSPHWLLDGAVGWTQVRPGVAGNPRSIHLDPVDFRLGVSYRFGGEAQR